ncbi:MAG: Flp pilus assembly complex ATPase component TadA [Gammaproteobacteria bacterium]|nr:Flp pilus assembly complex ATPase component TadA [Gammaproteobacteria bacterium]
MSAAEEYITQEVTRSRVGAMTYLAPRNKLVGDSIESFKAVVSDCIEKNENHIIVDLATTALINSAALDVLLDAQDELIKLGGSLKLANVKDNILEIFQITGFKNAISILKTDGQATVITAIQKDFKENVRLGDILLAKGIITAAQIEEGLKLQEVTGKKIGQVIVDRGWVSEQEILEALSEQLSVPYIRLRSGLYDPEIVNLLDKNVAKRLKVLPLFKIREELSLATADAQAVPSFNEVEERLGCRVRPILARREDILEKINEAYNNNLATDSIGEVGEDFEVVENQLDHDYAEIDEVAAESPVINLINSIIQRAVQDHASDIHIEPARGKSRVRFRIDGLLYEVMAPKAELHPALVSRLKVMANLDISERRLPQDGRIQVQTQGRSVDLRFSSLPGLYGEKVVLRVLDKNQAILDVNKLGMSKGSLNVFTNLLDSSYGLLLVTGPTGSGKTTSLYAAINHLNSIEKNIVTIEEPVEYQVDIVNQNEVKAKIGLTFAKVLKHVLRQDPDVVMVGEIRERETAEIAVQAALTGHLVLSTLHTNDSVGAINRMIDMGIEPYLLSSAMIGVVAQRLVRVICPACKTSSLAPPEIVDRYGWSKKDAVRLYRGRGCHECYDSGYKGRIGIYEALQVDAALQELIITNPSRDELDNYIEKNHIQTLFSDGLNRVREGVTTIEEVTRVVNT